MIYHFSGFECDEADDGNVLGKHFMTSMSITFDRDQACEEVCSDEDVTQARVTISDDDAATCAYDLFDSH